MLMKKLKKETHIVVLMGGLSEEREVSLETGKKVFESLKDEGYKNVETLDMTRSVGKELEKRTPEVIFNALHGTYGEDGRIQGMLDLMNIPYTGSGVTASAIAMDKIYSRAFMKHLGISCAEARIMNLTKESKPPFSFPFVVKDPRNGSSRGVFIVDTMEKWNEAVDYFSCGFPVVVECFFSGREINVAVMNDSVM
ncbi:MAG: D-alanine--D-alanine ligase, partial [bacterium]